MRIVDNPLCYVVILSRHCAFRFQLLACPDYGPTLLTSDDCTCSSTIIKEFPSNVVSGLCLSVNRLRGSRGMLRPGLQAGGALPNT